MSWVMKAPFLPSPGSPEQQFILRCNTVHQMWFFLLK